MESVSGGYARGYGMGVGERQFDERMAESKKANAYNMLQPFSLPGGRRSGGGGHSSNKMPSASEIKGMAVDDYLQKREQELELEREGLKNEIAQYRFGRERLNDLGADADKSQSRADQLRQENMQAEQDQKGIDTENAVRSLYMGDDTAFKTFFDKYGAAGVNVQGFEKQQDGSVEVFFGDGQSERFNDANEVVKKLLMPAAAITEEGFGGRAKKGDITDKDAADIKLKLRKQWYDAGNTGEPSQEWLDTEYGKISGQQAGGMQMGPSQPAGPEIPRPGMTPSGNTVQAAEAARAAEIPGAQKMIEAPKGETAITGKVRKEPKNFIITTDKKTGKKVKKAIEDGEIIEYEKDEKSGKWQPKGMRYGSETPVSEGEKTKKGGLDLSKYKTRDEKVKALRTHLSDEKGWPKSKIDNYIKEAKRKGKL